MVNERTKDIIKLENEKHEKHLEKVRKLMERLAEKEELVKKDLLRSFAESEEEDEDISGEAIIHYMMRDGSIKGIVTKKGWFYSKIYMEKWRFYENIRKV